MMRMCVLWLFILTVCLSAVSAGGNAGTGEMEWIDVSNGIRDAGLHSFTVSPSDPAVAYAGSGKAVFRTLDSGKSWTEVLSFRGADNGINTIAVNPLNMQSVYAGTVKGLYRSDDQGLHWERVFKGMGGPENMVFAVFINTNKTGDIYIGTQEGIFFTEDRGNTWAKAQNLPADIKVTSICADAHDPNVLYAATSRGIYKTMDSGSGWVRIHKSAFDDNNLNYFIVEDEETMEDVDITVMRDSSYIREVLPGPVDGRIIYAATSAGLLATNDGGLTWTLAGSTGLVSRNIRDIAISSGDTEHVYAATDRGIFRYSRSANSWDELYKGITSSDIRSLAFAPAEQNGPPVLWAVTGKGVYKSASPLPAAIPRSAGRQHEATEARNVLRMFDHEPSIWEIKEAAIEYADVSPDKIREWRKAAANRAWLPDLSVKYGSAEDWQNSSYFYSTKDEKYKDDDITEGRDSDWYISLTWNLGDLIWDDVQTSIDNRSKLMVQLRDDVLNEVTRLYFERRRLQIDLVMSPPGNDKDYIDKDLRLQELTASIDALTGSFLSARLAQKESGAQRQDLTVK